NLDAKTPFHIRGDERNTDKERDVKPALPRFLCPDGLKIRAVKLPAEAYQPLRRTEIAETYRKAATARLKNNKELFRELEKSVAGRGAPVSWAVLAVRKSVAGAEKELKELEAAIADPKKTPLALRGSVKSAESNVETAESKARPFPDTSTGRRTALANWIASATNPLTARVAVNHIWMRHFGQPLVPTVFEFGRRGTPPTHPELLDWLACELMERKWSLKHLHRLMVTSNVYRLSSSSANAGADVRLDGENHYLWRMNATRMDANVIRDSLLHLAGELDLTRGGPPVPPAEQDASHRRALYFFHSHNEHNILLDTFDNANVLECYRRTESIFPQQALALWNSKLAQEMAAKINDRLHSRLGKVDDRAFATAAFVDVLGSLPIEPEVNACLDTMAAIRSVLNKLDPEARTGRARRQLIQALLNHNDFITVK
ncbi:MAG TPA: DUF1553 domain-containing protein, partial [Gemmata sp.]|nr:DUF1553 domain-containing protein [Gemmata sp.]